MLKKLSKAHLKTLKVFFWKKDILALSDLVSNIGISIEKKVTQSFYPFSPNSLLFSSEATV